MRASRSEPSWGRGGRAKEGSIEAEEDRDVVRASGGEGGGPF